MNSETERHRQRVAAMLREEAEIDRGVDLAAQIFQEEMVQKQVKGVSLDDAMRCVKEWGNNEVPADEPLHIQMAPELAALIQDEQEQEIRNEVDGHITGGFPLREHCLSSKSWRRAFLQQKLKAKSPPKTWLHPGTAEIDSIEYPY